MTSCRRLLALGENVGAGPAGGVLSIDLGSRRATITVSHVGIDCEVIRHRLGQPEVTQQCEAFLSKRPDLRGRTILGGLEMLNKQQGVALKLLAFEQLLAHQLVEIGSDQGRVVLRAGRTSHPEVSPNPPRSLRATMQLASERRKMRLSRFHLAGALPAVAHQVGAASGRAARPRPPRGVGHRRR